jgi:hypothetical protein
MIERRRLVWERYTKRGVTDEREVTTPEAVLAEMSTEALVKELRRRGAIKRAGSLAMSRTCLNCGGDHMDAGCDAPDFAGIGLWRFVPERASDGCEPQ